MTGPKAYFVMASIFILAAIGILKNMEFESMKEPKYLKGNQSFITLVHTNPNIQRLGNQMFRFASLLGIAKMNQITAFTPCNFYLRTIFEIDLPCLRKDEAKLPKENIRTEQRPGVFTPSLAQIRPHKKVLLSGYFQSWKYFHRIAAYVKRQFTFRTHISRKARAALDSAERNHNLKGKTYTRIGIHIRRGDMASKISLRRGYTVANKEYIRDSMSKMRSIFNQSKALLFIVCTDDYTWAKKNVHGSDVEFMQCRIKDPYRDLAILSMCNATIITTGTFGWWAAWLAGGPVIYYPDFPRPNSTLASHYKREDYFHPNWIAM